MRKIKNLIIGIILVSLVIPVSLLAYSYSGYKWFQWPFTIRTVDIDPIGRNTAEELAIRNAMFSWTNAGAKFFYVDTATSGNDFGYYYEVSNDLAVNRIETNWLGYITRTYIRVNTYHPWATNGDANSFDFESMAVHELGHGLRLLHSDDTEATMYYTLARGETKKRTLEIDDKNGIKYIYGTL